MMNLQKINRFLNQRRAMSQVPSFDPALATMRALAAQASAGVGKATAVTAQPAAQQAQASGFATELQNVYKRINTLKVESAEKGRAFQAGDPDITLNDLMIDMQKASVATQFGIQVRNRLMTAYNDIKNLQV
jgi:flagellar hook-basal body complex protein FliE